MLEDKLKYIKLPQEKNTLKRVITEIKKTILSEF
jgi:hypothetical protein